MKNNKGFILITVIIFSAAALILAIAMYFATTNSTKFSGAFRQFNSLKEAADTGINIGIELINKPNASKLLNYNINSIICGTFGEYMISNPDNSTCKQEAETKPWIDITENGINLKIYIIKLYQSHIAGAGGAASFPPSYGGNIQKYQYYLKIISKAEEASSGNKITAEALYRYTF
jgi:hypothetical protein